MKKRRTANIRWDRQATRPGPEVFQTEILPKLSAIPLKKMVETTGLSKSYCSLIRRGGVIPHPSHWEALYALGHDTA